jgi:hypothetical protein
MMQTFIETSETARGLCCSRQQARELLESLRAAYQALPSHEQMLVKGMVSQLARVQSVLETE